MYLGLYVKHNITFKGPIGLSTSKIRYVGSSLDSFLVENKKAIRSITTTSILHLEGIPFSTTLLPPKGDLQNKVLKLYHKQRLSCITNFTGNWAFTIWEEEEQQLVLARDKYGVKTIYYYDCADFFVFSTHLELLLKLPFLPKELNTSAIMQLGPGGKKDAQTFYKGINQLPSAHYLTLTKGVLNLHSYWIPKSQPLLRYKCFDEYVEHFDMLFTKAVEESLAGFKKPGIALSSGLDSGSIYSIAAPYLKKSKTKIEAITWRTDTMDPIMYSPNRLLDESALVKQLISNSDNTALNIVTSKTGNILSFHRQIIENCHQPMINIQPHMQEVYERGKELGIDVLLNGFGGNFSVSWTGNRSFKINSFYSLLSLAKTVIKKASNRISNPDSFLPFKNTSRDYIRSSAIEENIKYYHALTPELEQMRKNNKDPLNHILNYFQSNFLNTLTTYTESLGYESRVPVLDERIIDFCLRIPNSIFNHNGQQKRLLKAAMHDKMPHSVLYNQQRGLQGRNYVSKFREEYQAIKNVLDEFGNSKLVNYWLDVELVKEHLKIYTTTTSKKHFRTVSTNVLFRGLQLGLFLQRFENGKY